MDGQISPLDFSMFSREDVRKLCHQRTNNTKMLANDPALDEDGPEYEALKARIISAVYQEIVENFNEIEETIARIAPLRVADIGCGYAFVDLMLHRRFGCKVLLIDIEETDEIYFKFREQGAGYSNLATARAFLEANGVPAADIRTVNPTKQDLTKAGKVDLAISLLSCGFHYPAATYETFYRDQVSRAVLLDVRNRTDGREVLDRLGPTRIVVSGRKHECIVARKW